MAAGHDATLERATFSATQGSVVERPLFYKAAFDISDHGRNVLMLCLGHGPVSDSSSYQEEGEHKPLSERRYRATVSLEMPCRDLGT